MTSDMPSGSAAPDGGAATSPHGAGSGDATPPPAPAPTAQPSGDAAPPPAAGPTAPPSGDATPAPVGGPTPPPSPDPTPAPSGHSGGSTPFAGPGGSTPPPFGAAPGPGPAAPPPPGGATATPFAAGRPPLRRSLTDRRVAGVCGGLGQHTGVDPLVYRVLVAVLTLFGGVGLLLYALAWLLVPEEGAAESEGQRIVNGRGDATGIGVLVLVALGVAASGGLLLGRPGAATVTVLVVAAIAMVALLSRRTGSSSLFPLASAGPVPPTSGVGWSPAGTGTATSGSYGPGGTATAMSAPHAGTSPFGSSGYGPNPYGPNPYGSSSAAQNPYGTNPYGTNPYGTVRGPGTGTAYAPTRPAWTPPPPPPPRERSPLGLVTLGMSLLTGAVLWALQLAGVAELGPRVILSAMLLVIAVGIVVSAFVGRALWLLLPAIPLALAIGVVSAVEPTLGHGTGNPVWSPTAASATAGHPLDYRLGGGDATLDLSALPLSGRAVDITAKVGAGHLAIRVPTGLSVKVVAHVGTGEVRVPTRVVNSGVNVHQTWSQGSPPPQVTVDADVTVGMVEVLDAQA